MNEDITTSLVGFRNVNHAVLIAKMIESYYITQKEWPDTTGRLILPAPRSGDLEFLFLRRWDLADLQVTCTKNFLNLVSVEDLDETTEGFSFNGNLMIFSAEHEFYAQRLNEILELE
jgi:hypothetical protein